MIGHARVVQGAETTDVPPGRRIQDHERKAPFGFVVATECRDIEAAVALLAEDGVFLRAVSSKVPASPVS